MFVRRGLAGVALAVVCVPRPAFADEGYAFRLEYAAAPECPRADGFSRSILSSSARAHVASPDEPATSVSVQVFAQAGGYLGLLDLKRADGTQSTRAVPAATCEEAVSAMALIAAIAIDPEASVPKAGPGAIGAFDAPVTTPPPPAPPPAPVIPLLAPPPPAPPPPLPRRDVTATLLLGGGVVGAVGPSLSPELVVPGLALGLSGDDVVSPWVSLTGHLAESLSTSTARGDAQFERLGARLTACPLRFARGPWAARPCLFGEVGRFHAKGESTRNAETVNLTWGALGVVGRGEVELPADFLVGAELGVILPLLRDSFRFAPDGTQAHSIPGAGFSGSVFVGFRIL